MKTFFYKNEKEANDLSQKMSAVFQTHPALSTMECRLPDEIISKLNKYIDSQRPSAKSHAPNLVGQINADKDSAQLAMDLKQDCPESLAAILELFGTYYMQAMGVTECNVECDDMWTVHSYAGDYNPTHNHFVKTTMGLSCILYLKLSDEMEKVEVSVADNDWDGNTFNPNLVNATGATDGHTFFEWGVHGTQDVEMMRYSTEMYTKPEVGKLLIFPHWLRHSVSPFKGNGERRTLSANFNVHTNQKIHQQLFQQSVIGDVESK